MLLLNQPTNKDTKGLKMVFNQKQMNLTVFQINNMGMKVGERTSGKELSWATLEHSILTSYTKSNTKE